MIPMMYPCSLHLYLVMFLPPMETPCPAMLPCGVGSESVPEVCNTSEMTKGVVDPPRNSGLCSRASPGDTPKWILIVSL